MSLLTALGLPAAAGKANAAKPPVRSAPPAKPGAALAGADAPAETAAAGGKAGEGEKKPEAPSPTLPFEFPLNIDLPEASLSYVTAKARITYLLTINPADEEGSVDVKFANLKPEVKLSYQKEVQFELAKKYGKKLKISDTLTTSKEGGVLGFDIDLEDEAVKGAKLTAAFHIVETDNEKHSVEFLAFEAADTVPLIKRKFEIAGMRLGYSGQIVVKVSFQPNWKKIGAYILQKLGITIAEDAALSTAVGGTGTAGAAAVAAASSPVIVVAAGVIGGVALTVGVMAIIGNLEAQGSDAALTCTECAKQLWSYAESYGSTMRGKPGKSAAGNQDGEAALSKIMSAAPGTTHAQAVEAAMQSGQNFYELSYRAVLPKMREAATQAYKKLHPNADLNVFHTVLEEVMSTGSHYGSAPPVARTPEQDAKIQADADQSGPRFERARGIENDIKAARTNGMRLSVLLEQLAEKYPNKAAASAYKEAFDLYQAAEQITKTMSSCVTPPPNTPLDQLVAGVLDKGGRALDDYNKAIKLIKKGIALYSVAQVKGVAGV